MSSENPYRVETSGELEFNAKVIGPDGVVVSERVGMTAKISCQSLALRLNAAFAAGRAEGEALAVALEAVANAFDTDPNGVPARYCVAWAAARAALARWRQSNDGGSR